MPEAKRPILEVRDLRKHYPIDKRMFGRPRGNVRAVDGVSFTVGEGEVLGLAGESGSGKSTIGRCVLRLIEPTSGEVVFDDRDVMSQGREDMRSFRRKAQMIFQDPFASLNPKMTIFEILSEPMRVQKIYKTNSECRARALELLQLVSLPDDYLKRYPSELSGGQRQRIGIARALAGNPSFLVADEPLASLDVSIQAQIMNLIADLRRSLNLSMLFISHDIAAMAHLSDRLAVLYLGKLMETGASEDVARTPLHPYSQALISAVPDHDPDSTAFQNHIILEGEIPSPAAPPSGCVFRTRCPKAVPDCATTVPELREVAPGRFVSCIRV